MCMHVSNWEIKWRERNDKIEGPSVTGLANSTTIYIIEAENCSAHWNWHLTLHSNVKANLICLFSSSHTAWNIRLQLESSSILSNNSHSLLLKQVFYYKWQHCPYKSQIFCDTHCVRMHKLYMQWKTYFQITKQFLSEKKGGSMLLTDATAWSSHLIINYLKPFKKVCEIFIQSLFLKSNTTHNSLKFAENVRFLGWICKSKTIIDKLICKNEFITPTNFLYGIGINSCTSGTQKLFILTSVKDHYRAKYR